MIDPEDDIFDEALNIYESVAAESEIQVTYSIDKKPTGEETLAYLILSKEEDDGNRYYRLP